ncbi:MAG: aldehyde dehydrogenase (NADP(+)) [Ferruginibacter sp.]
MLKGFNLAGFTESNEGDQFIQSYSTTEQKDLPEKFFIATTQEIDKAVALASKAFEIYRSVSPEARALFLETIAAEILLLDDGLIKRAMLETGLPEARLINERGRTTGQLKLFAAVLREGSWVEAVIDEALPGRQPLPRADIRKMLVPLGPVAIFGASNFPFAFSTAGGDTAAALASGNPVIVKAHESHLGTNELMATAVKNAAIKCNMPDGVFSFIIGNDPAISLQLVKQPGICAVGFTGSYNAGMSIYKTAAVERATPIPVYAEMSSINPVILLPGKLRSDTTGIAAMLAGSISLGVGQFCTNPGLLFLIKDENTGIFIQQLSEKLAAIPAGSMLNKNVCTNYYRNKASVTSQAGISIVYEGSNEETATKGTPALLQTTAANFISNTALQTEIFGPASLLVLCDDKTEMQHALEILHGQLTGTVIGTIDDIKAFRTCIDVLSSKTGRLIYNAVPTGVEVCHAMVHGGPYPATTDSRSTSVGADAIKRFARPLCWQDCPMEFLPAALQNDNPLNIMRKINGQYTNKVL